MGCVRGLVTLIPVKQQLGVRFQQEALPVDQTLASVSVPPCWQPSECFSEVLWGLLGESGLILHSSEPCCFTLSQRHCFSLRGLGCGQAHADIELPLGIPPPSPTPNPYPVYGEAGGIRALGHPAFALSLWLLTIPVSKSCQRSALCLPLAFCCGVHLEWLCTLLEPLNLAGVLKRRYTQY